MLSIKDTTELFPQSSLQLPISHYSLLENLRVLTRKWTLPAGPNQVFTKIKKFDGDFNRFPNYDISSLLEQLPSAISNPLESIF